MVLSEACIIPLSSKGCCKQFTDTSLLSKLHDTWSDLSDVAAINNNVISADAQRPLQHSNLQGLPRNVSACLYVLLAVIKASSRRTPAVTQSSLVLWDSIPGPWSHMQVTGHKCIANRFLANHMSCREFDSLCFHRKWTLGSAEAAKLFSASTRKPRTQTLLPMYCTPVVPAIKRQWTQLYAGLHQTRGVLRMP